MENLCKRCDKKQVCCIQENYKAIQEDFERSLKQYGEEKGFQGSLSCRHFRPEVFTYSPK